MRDEYLALMGILLIAVCSYGMFSIAATDEGRAEARQEQRREWCQALVERIDILSDYDTLSSAQYMLLEHTHIMFRDNCVPEYELGRIIE